ncbi:MAG: hypothetical protein NC180_06860 [Muribaculaceae bacterium]|nr:flagellar biosynthesis protein FlgL [Roseburia sp.]MCM1429872.1 hypothetical protein [Muribaculaceae bacterium]MCM1492923.1 hypothetical protein [Muribaculaceae bacterium]
MRVTNNMITANAKTNINSNKVLVDKYNTQMTTQKKISKASENPVIAIRALRMQTNMSHIEQYLDHNIAEVNAWLDVTETALTNMKSILTDIRTQCVNGSTDTLTADDRQTILKSLSALADQVYTEGNADYAGRTVFTGYRTGSQLTFMEDRQDITYAIDQSFSYTELHDHRYYYGEAEVPADAGTPCTTEIGTQTYSRLRLAYGETDALDSTDKLGNQAEYSFSFTYGTSSVADEQVYVLPEGYTSAIPEGATVHISGGTEFEVTDNSTLVLADAASITYADGSTGVLPAGTYAALPGGVTTVLPAGSTVTQEDGTVTTLPAGTNTLPKGSNVTTELKMVAAADAAEGDIKVYENEEEWCADTADDPMALGDNEIIYIRSTGEFVFGKDIAHTITQNKATVDVTYTKTGFDEGEERPEYYYDCRMSSPDLAEKVTYVKENQQINFTISNGITIPANTQASEVFDTSIARDVDEMIDIVNKAIAAHDKVDRIEEMMKRDQFASPEDQKVLEGYLAAAKKEADYADNDLRRTYSQYITNFDNYLEKVNIGITNVGSLEKRLDLTKTRIENQKMTVEGLQSDNEDRCISDIIIDYYASYNAYTASLMAAAKVGEQTLLNYL